MTACMSTTPLTTHSSEYHTGYALIRFASLHGSNEAHAYAIGLSL